MSIRSNPYQIQHNMGSIRKNVRFEFDEFEGGQLSSVSASAEPSISHVEHHSSVNLTQEELLN